MTPTDEQILNKIIAASGWAYRATKLYRGQMAPMPASGNRALAQASLAIRDAEKMMRDKMSKE